MAVLKTCGQILHGEKKTKRNIREVITSNCYHFLVFNFARENKFFAINRPYNAHDVISVGRPHQEVKRRLFIGQCCAPRVQICAFQLFCHRFSTKMTAGWHQCIRSIQNQLQCPKPLKTHIHSNNFEEITKEGSHFVFKESRFFCGFRTY